MLARLAVDVRPPPRIDQHFALPEVGSVPALGVGGTLDQGVKAVILGQVAADVQAIEIEGRAQALDLDLRGVGLGPAEVLQDLRHGDEGQQAQDGEHHQKLDQGEARGAATAGHLGVCVHGHGHRRSLQPIENGVGCRPGEPDHGTSGRPSGAPIISRPRRFTVSLVQSRGPVHGEMHCLGHAPRRFTSRQRSRMRPRPLFSPFQPDPQPRHG